MFLDKHILSIFKAEFVKNLSIFEPQIEKYYAYINKTCTPTSHVFFIRITFRLILVKDCIGRMLTLSHLIIAVVSRRASYARFIILITSNSQHSDKQ